MLRFIAVWAVGTVTVATVHMSGIQGFMWPSLVFIYPYFAVVSLAIGIGRTALLGSQPSWAQVCLAATATWTATLGLAPLADLILLSRNSYFFEASWLLCYPWYLLVTVGFGAVAWLVARKSGSIAAVPRRYVILQMVAAALALAVSIIRTTWQDLGLPPEVFYVAGLAAAGLALAAAPCRRRQRRKAQLATAH